MPLHIADFPAVPNSTTDHGVSLAASSSESSEYVAGTSTISPTAKEFCTETQMTRNRQTLKSKGKGKVNDKGKGKGKGKDKGKGKGNGNGTVKCESKGKGIKG